MTTVHLNIGSNLGDRQANIRLAFTEISALNGVTNPRLSSFVESEPWGYNSSNNFINAGVMLQTNIPPHKLLYQLQEIERKLGSITHRAPDGSYIDRIIDIDIILYGNLTIDTPELTVPHPRMFERPFVMTPLLELISHTNSSFAKKGNEM